MDIKLESLRSFLDQFGRLVPFFFGLAGRALEDNGNFYLQQPVIDYPEIHARFVEAFPDETPFLSLEKFIKKAEESRKKIERDNFIRNIFKQVHFPLLLPHYSMGDYCYHLQNFFFLAVEKAYQKQFPQRNFVNRCDGKLDGQVSAIFKIGNELIELMKKGPGMAWYFPCSMKGVSIIDQRRIAGELQKHGLILAGAIESALGFVGFSKEMARDQNVPGIDCSGVLLDQRPDHVLNFRVKNDQLIFDISENKASGSCSGGLIFLG